MIVTIEQLRRGVANYADAEIGQKATGPAKFMVYFALPSLTASIDKAVDKLRGSALAEGIFDDGGNIDLDALHTRSMDAMRHCGSVEMAGIRFRESDIDALRDYIERA